MTGEIRCTYALPQLGRGSQAAERLATGGIYFVYFRFRAGSILADLQDGAADGPELEEGCPLRDLLYVLSGWPPVCASTSVCTPVRTACPFNVSAVRMCGLTSDWACLHCTPVSLSMLDRFQNAAQSTSPG